MSLFQILRQNMMHNRMMGNFREAKTNRPLHLRCLNNIQADMHIASKRTLEHCFVQIAQQYVISLEIEHTIQLLICFVQEYQRCKLSKKKHTAKLRCCRM